MVNKRRYYLSLRYIARQHCSRRNVTIAAIGEIGGGRHNVCRFSTGCFVLTCSGCLPEPSTGPPPAARWIRRKPEAAARLEAARAGLAELSQRVSVPTENLVTPEIVRRLC